MSSPLPHVPLPKYHPFSNLGRRRICRRPTRDAVISVFKRTSLSCGGLKARSIRNGKMRSSAGKSTAARNRQ
jgi:hypothetical protein